MVSGFEGGFQRPYTNGLRAVHAISRKLCPDLLLEPGTVRSIGPGEQAHAGPEMVYLFKGTRTNTPNTPHTYSHETPEKFYYHSKGGESLLNYFIIGFVTGVITFFLALVLVSNSD